MVQNALFMLIPLILIGGISCIFFKTTRMTAVEAFLAAICSIILCLQIFGRVCRLDLLLYLLYGISACGVLFFLFSKRIFHKIKICRNEKTVREFFSPAMIAIIAVYCVTLVLFYGVGLHNFDELSTWGFYQKQIFETGVLPKNTGYPLGGATFGYFFTKITGYRECNLYSSSFLLWFAFAMAPMCKVGWKGWKRCLAYAFFLYIAVFSLYLYPYFTLYNDFVLGVISASGILLVLLHAPKERASLIVPVLSVFTLLFLDSSSGLFFALFTAGMMVLLLYWKTRAELKDNGINALSGSRVTRFLKRYSKLVLFLLFGLAILFIAGYVLLRFNGNTVESAIGLREKLVATAKAAISAVFQKPLGNKSSLKVTLFTALVFSALAGGLSYYLMKEQKQRKQYLSLLITYLFGAGIYVIAIVLYYVLAYPDYYATTVQSIARYFASYAVIGVLLSAYPAFSGYEITEKFKKLLSLFLAAGMILIAATGLNKDFITYGTFLNKQEITRYERVEDVKKQAERLKTVLAEGEKVFVISQYGEENNLGIEVDTARYVLGEEHVFSKFLFPYYFVPKGKEDAIQKTYFPLESLKKQLLTTPFHYIWVYETNDYVTEEFQALFGIEAHSGDFFRLAYTEDDVFAECVFNSKTGS